MQLVQNYSIRKINLLNHKIFLLYHQNMIPLKDDIYTKYWSPSHNRECSKVWDWLNLIELIYVMEALYCETTSYDHCRHITQFRNNSQWAAVPYHKNNLFFLSLASLSRFICWVISLQVTLSNGLGSVQSIIKPGEDWPWICLHLRLPVHVCACEGVSMSDNKSKTKIRD